MREASRALVAVTFLVAAATTAGAQAPPAAHELPTWPSATLPLDPTPAGPRAMVCIGENDETYGHDGCGAGLVHDVDELERFFAGALRGYRRREGMRGGTGALVAIVRAHGSLPVSRLAALVPTTRGYSGWPSCISLAVALPDGRRGELPLAVVVAGRASTDVSFRGRTTFQQMVAAIAARAPAGRVRVRLGL